MSAPRILTLLLAFAGLAACVHPGNVDVGVRASGEIAPGVYGRVDVRNRPPPPVVYAEPVVIVRPRGALPRPIYVHVPPGHAKKWDKHCHKYDACGIPVYFVKSMEYEPGYKRPTRGQGRDDDDDDDDDDRRGRRR